MCAEGRRPVCQDTGIVVVFPRIGMDVRWDADLSVEDVVNEAVRRAYRDPDNTLRASIVSGPAGDRTNTRDNTPAVIPSIHATGPAQWRRLTVSYVP